MYSNDFKTYRTYLSFLKNELWFKYCYLDFDVLFNIYYVTKYLSVFMTTDVATFTMAKSLRTEVNFYCFY